jgi:DNA-binding transcriptional regulator/RsmH inhibitor MraZ
MITQEQFDTIVKQAIAGESIPAVQVMDLIQTIAELEQRTNMAQGIVEFVLHGAEQVYHDTAERVVRQLNLRDHAKIKRILKIGEEASSSLTAAAQIYIAQVLLQTNESAVADTEPNILDNGDPA